MKKYIFLYLLILSCFSQGLFGQTKNIKSGYISLHSGAYTILSSNYDKYYNSKFGYIIGGSLGVPFSSNFSFFGKLSYFENNAIPISDITGVREGTSILKQVIVNIGIQLKTLQIEGVSFYAQTGLTGAIVDEERTNPEGAFTYETEGTGNLGIIIGGIIEVNLGSSPFSLTGEFNYIYSWKPILEYDETYKAFNVVGGVRYRFR